MVLFHFCKMNKAKNNGKTKEELNIITSSCKEYVLKIKNNFHAVSYKYTLFQWNFCVSFKTTRDKIKIVKHEWNISGTFYEILQYYIWYKQYRLDNIFKCRIKSCHVNRMSKIKRPPLSLEFISKGSVML